MKPKNQGRRQGRSTFAVHRILTPILLAAMLVALAPVACLARTAVVVYSDGRPSERLPILEKEAGAYIAASQLARLMGLARVTDLENGRVILRRDDHAAEITIGGTVWMVDGQAVAPDEPAFVEAEEVYVSLASAQTILAQVFSRSLKWDAAQGQLLVGLPAPNIIDIEIRSEPEVVFATIKTIGMLRYDLRPEADGRLEILIRGGTFSKHLGFEAPGGMIERLTASQEAEGARITMTLGAGEPSYRVYPRWEPDGIVIKVWNRVLAEIPEPQLMPPRRIAWQEHFTEDRARLDLVVIDPGHGGSNRGSVGATGYLEKDFNLALARRVKAALEARGIEVMMTRNEDIFVPLETRTELANSVGADLFISVHANGFTSKEARGFEVYFLSPPADAMARYLAATGAGNGHTASSGLEGDDDVGFILWDTAQTEFVDESSYLAQLVNEEIDRATDMPNRGVKQADFFILKGAYLPGILVESGFLTNPQEEALLKTDDFQAALAGAIVAAVAKFKEEYNR